jgi:hypothetical protein
MPAKKQSKADLDFAIARSYYKNNKAYEQASPASRRLMIAKDALQQLKAGRFTAKQGTYLYAGELAEESGITETAQLHTLLHNPTLKSSCTVCARGALLLSAVRFRNDVTIDPLGGTSENSQVDEFEDQQYTIESAFEDDDSDWAGDFLSEKEMQDPDKRLELILKNIIRNSGTFKKNQR